MAGKAVGRQHGPNPHLEKFISVRALRPARMSKANQPKQACKHEPDMSAG